LVLSSIFFLLLRFLLPWPTVTLLDGPMETFGVGTCPRQKLKMRGQLFADVHPVMFLAHLCGYLKLPRALGLLFPVNAIRHFHLPARPAVFWLALPG